MERYDGSEKKPSRSCGLLPPTAADILQSIVPHSVTHTHTQLSLEHPEIESSKAQIIDLTVLDNKQGGGGGGGAQAFSLSFNRLTFPATYPADLTGDKRNSQIFFFDGVCGPKNMSENHSEICLSCGTLFFPPSCALFLLCHRAPCLD